MGSGEYNPTTNQNYSPKHNPNLSSPIEIKKATEFETPDWMNFHHREIYKKRSMRAATKFNSSMQIVQCPALIEKNIVDTHNKWRLKIAKGQLKGQPKASNMQKMVWDESLAIQAEIYANKMLFVHNRNRQDSRFYVGENLYQSSASKSSNVQANVVDSWAGEHTVFKFNVTSNAITGHYRQVVCASTIYVGCGYKEFRSGRNYNKLYVCNYGPGENLAIRAPYEIGNGCDNLSCKNQCSKIYGNGC